MGGENSLCSISPHLYHLSASKNCTISGLPMRYENFMSFSFEFRCNLANRETTEVASLLSLLKGCSGRRDVRAWNPNPSWGFSYRSMFSLLLDLAPLKWSVFDVVCRIKALKKVRFFIWQVLLGQVNTVDRLVRRTPLVGPFYCMLCRKVEEDLDNVCWDC